MLHLDQTPTHPPADTHTHTQTKSPPFPSVWQYWPPVVTVSIRNKSWWLLYQSNSSGSQAGKRKKLTVSFISQCFTDFLIAIAWPPSWHWVCFCLQWEQERPPSHQKANCSKSGDYTLKPPPPVSPNPAPRKLHSIILSLYMIKCCSANDRLLSREEKKTSFFLVVLAD